MESSIVQEFLTFQEPDQVLAIARIVGLAAFAFIVAIAWTPLLSSFLYKYKLGKRIRSAEKAPVFQKLHKKKEGTPTMGGLLVWVTVLVLALIFWLLDALTASSFFEATNFLTRQQTLLPLGAMVIAGIVGIVDDLMNIWKKGPNGGGLSAWQRFLLYLVVAAGGAWWFYFKLGWDFIHVPALGTFVIGWWIIPIFIFIIAATSHSANITDGLDGLLGGIMMIAFSAYAAISLSQGKIELAIFCAVIVGALLAFLWFNINPARFFMGDTGSMSLGVTLGVIAMLTNTVLVLPLIAFVLVVETLSVIVQTFSKKVFGKKIFISTPIHHHFEAQGWPEPKVTMRFWIIAGVVASIGTMIGIIGQG